MVTRLARALLVLACMASVSSCDVFVREPWDEMSEWFDELELPPGFELVAKSVSGTSSAISSQPPSMKRSYEADWKDGALCAEISDLARRFGALTEEDRWEETCRAYSGVRNERYGLRIFAMAPSRVERWSDICERSKQSSARAASEGFDPMWNRPAGCFVPDGRALVTIEIVGG